MAFFWMGNHLSMDSHFPNRLKSVTPMRGWRLIHKCPVNKLLFREGRGPFPYIIPFGYVLVYLADSPHNTHSFTKCCCGIRFLHHPVGSWTANPSPFPGLRSFPSVHISQHLHLLRNRSTDRRNTRHTDIIQEERGKYCAICNDFKH